MGAIFRAPRLRDPRVVPTEPVEIDWSHPLAQELVGLFIPGAPNTGFRDLCGNGSLTPGTGTFVNGPSGVGYQTLNFADAATMPIVGTPWMNISAYSAVAYSIFWRGTMAGGDPGTGLPWLFGADTSNDTSRGWIIYNAGAASDYYFVCGNQYTSFGIPIPSVKTAPVSLGVTIGGVAQRILCFYNGAQVASGSGNGSSASGQLLYLGGQGGAISEAAAIYSTSNVNWAWLHAEPFAMLRPTMRRRYFTVPSGSIITTRGILAAEWLATQQAKEVVATEMSGLLSRSSEVFAEFDQAVIRNDVMPLEIAMTAKKTTTIPEEYDGTILSALQAPVEYLGSASATKNAAIEYAGTAMVSKQAPIEYLGSTAGAEATSTEWLATSVASTVVPVEWAGAALVTSGATVALEWTTALDIGIVSPAEFLTALGTNVTLNADWSGAVLSNVTVTFETGKTLQVSDIVATDWAATLSAANIIPADWTAGRSISLTIPIEWSGSAGAAIQANALMSIEWAVASLIVPDWRFAVTFLPAIDRVGFQTPIDEIGFNEPVDEVVLQ